MRTADWFQQLPLKQREAIPYLVLVMAVLAAYANVYHNDFVFDDTFLIVHNEFLKSWSRLPDLLLQPGIAGSGRAGGFYRPVPELLHFFVYQAFGASVIAFHALNVVLHAANVCLVYLLGRRLSFKTGAAFAGALLWGVHPLHTETVAFMSATPELLWSFFCLLGLVALVPDFAPRRVWTAGAFFLLALGCKETAMIFPALASLCLFVVRPERQRLKTYIKTWPFWTMSVIYIAAQMSYLHAMNANLRDPWDATDFGPYMDSLPVRLFTSLATLPVYLKLILWPAGLHMERVFPVFVSFLSVPVLAGAALAGTGFLLVLWCAAQLRRNAGEAKRRLPATFGILWFAVALAPATGVLVPVNALISEHWMYFPTIGLFLGTTATAAEFLDKKTRIAIVLAALTAVSLGVKTHFQNTIWKSPITFYENILANGGRPGRAHEGLGAAYMAEGAFDQAIEHYKILQSLPHGSDPSHILDLHVPLALAYMRVRADRDLAIRPEDVEQALPLSRHIPEAVEELTKAIEVDPGDPFPYIYLSIISDYQGDRDKAAAYNQQAEELLVRKQH